MRYATPLPHRLHNQPVTAAQLGRLGIPRERLRRHDLVPVGSGVYAPRHLAESTDDFGRYLMRAHGVLRDYHNAAFCHLTAAHMWGCPIPRRPQDLDNVHIGHAKENRLQIRRAGVRGHRLTLSPGDLTTLAGLAITSAPRTWRDLARYYSEDQLVAAGDHLVRIPRHRIEARLDPHCTVDDLAAAIDSSPRFPGRTRATFALKSVRVGSDSAAETLLRLRLVQAGLAEPALQIPHIPGGLHCADMGYPEQMIAIQYDGDTHFHADQARRDQRRDNAFVAAGWVLLRFNRDDYRDGFSQAVRQVAQALHR